MRFKRNSRIIVQNGINVKEQRSEFAEGNHFAGSSDNYDTYLIGEPGYGIWKISFINTRTGTQYRIKFGGALWIGREEQMDRSRICLSIANDLKISKSHCVIYDVNGQLYIKDLGSKNHTFLNGKKVGQPLPLMNGDLLRIGNTALKAEFGRG